MSINLTYINPDFNKKKKKVMPVSSVQVIHQNMLKTEYDKKKKSNSSEFQEILDQSIKELDQNVQKTI